MRTNTPIYQRVADDLRAQIADGTRPPGSQLPTEAELQEKYGATRYTVRQGLAALVNEGLIVSRRPLGHFVREIHPMIYRPQQEFRQKAPDLDLFTQLLADEGNGRQPSQDIGVAIVKPTDVTADRLKLTEDELLAARHRTRYIDGEPYNINDSYVRLSLVKDSEYMSPVDVARGTNQVLADLGKPLVRALDEMYVRMPRPEEVTRLKLGPGTPVAEHIVTTYTFEDEPVQVTINIVPGDRHVIIFERTREWPPTEQEAAS
ncbi:GntR family transcriptional regulator [Streptomyces jumonjinensis]|uniref:GntR family transcriptional regulator n=1 Tax=Streptomyces jumonjinensis TaxID=1945 RepID=UPI00332F2F4F